MLTWVKRKVMTDIENRLVVAKGGGKERKIFNAYQ